MAANVSFECNTEEYNRYLLMFVLPSIFVFMLLVPILMFVGLNKAASKKILNKIAVKYKYGFLYNEYKNTAFFWEFVKIA